ncbi:HET-domain-containing protein [Annulohypoxylon nitens]|nr:HET-domain-containing protein [Annulohypoxylon nitens]
MRLLNARSLKLASFEGQEIPKYAILSHTWEKEGEVTFEDLSKNNYKHKGGYSKIEGCRQLAIRHGCDWFWVDTCCIDKSSSAELSEAINSIGWTLQELLAPNWVEFYDASWENIGSRYSMVNIISEITGIGAVFLEYRYNIKGASIALKLSWASQRKTSREEDMAYCLMGLLDVNMPLLYGEGGTKAFQRLQKELIKDNYDHSIFAWKFEHGFRNSELGQFGVLPLLAPSPALFSGWDTSINLIPPQGKHYFSTNLGLFISLPIIFLSEEIGLGLLDCADRATQNRITLPLFIEYRKDGLPIGTKCHDISSVTIPESATRSVRFTDIYLRDSEHFLIIGDSNVCWSALSINDYELADYFPPDNGNMISSTSGNFSGCLGDFLIRFCHEYLDDILIMGRKNPPDTHSPIKNGIQAFRGYVAITTINSNICEEEDEQESIPPSSWKLLLQPDFDRINFDRVERSFQWGSSVEVVMNHLEYPGVECARRARFRLDRTEGKPYEQVLSVLPAPVLETILEDSSSKPSP